MPKQPVQISLAPEGLVHLNAVLAHGFLDGPLGNKKVNDNLRDLVDGVYQVLAGGTVHVNVTKPGTLAKFKALKDKEADSLKSSNDFNRGQPSPIVVDI